MPTVALPGPAVQYVGRAAPVRDRRTADRRPHRRGQTAFRLSRYREARLFVDDALKASPYSEQAWQLAISLAHASGSDDAVLALYKRYTATMREFGVAPSTEVRRLVTRLRR